MTVADVRSERTSARVLVAAAGTLAVTAYAAWAAWQILVLNPLTAVPGATLGEIHAQMRAAGESPGHEMVFGWLGIGVALALGLLAWAARARTLRAGHVATVYLVLLALGAPGYFFASFGPGMSLADTFAIGGGDHSPWARPLYIVSTAALVALGLLSASLVRSARSTGTQPT